MQRSSIYEPQNTSTRQSSFLHDSKPVQHDLRGFNTNQHIYVRQDHQAYPPSNLYFQNWSMNHVERSSQVLHQPSVHGRHHSILGCSGLKKDTQVKPLDMNQVFSDNKSNSFEHSVANSGKEFLLGSPNRLDSRPLGYSHINRSYIQGPGTRHDAQGGSFLNSQHQNQWTFEVDNELVDKQPITRTKTLNYSSTMDLPTTFHQHHDYRDSLGISGDNIGVRDTSFVNQPYSHQEVSCGRLNNDSHPHEHKRTSSNLSFINHEFVPQKARSSAPRMFTDQTETKMVNSNPSSSTNFQSKHLNGSLNSQSNQNNARETPNCHSVTSNAFGDNINNEKSFAELNTEKNRNGKQRKLQKIPLHHDEVNLMDQASTPKYSEINQRQSFEMISFNNSGQKTIAKSAPRKSALKKTKSSGLKKVTIAEDHNERFEVSRWLKDIDFSDQSPSNNSRREACMQSPRQNVPFGIKHQSSVAFQDATLSYSRDYQKNVTQRNSPSTNERPVSTCYQVRQNK